MPIKALPQTLKRQQVVPAPTLTGTMARTVLAEACGGRERDEGDHLQSFPQTHAVGQDTAKATTGLKSLQGLNQVIVEESDPHQSDREQTQISLWLAKTKGLVYFGTSQN